MIYKRGKVYWYKFTWDGQSIRKSTRQGNDKVARQMESAHRTSLAKGEVGIREKKKVPTLGAFCKNRLEPWAKSTFESTTPNTWFWFRTGVKAICGDKQLSALLLNEVKQRSTFAILGKATTAGEEDLLCEQHPSCNPARPAPCRRMGLAGNCPPDQAAYRGESPGIMSLHRKSSGNSLHSPKSMIQKSDTLSCVWLKPDSGLKSSMRCAGRISTG